MDDRAFLAKRIKDIEASVAYFSPGNKQVAERWIAASFIENLRVSHAESEIISPNDDPPDVVFRDARFEIKEILDPGRRRHDEYKAELARAKTLSDPKDLLQMCAPKDESLGEVYHRCEEASLALHRKYPLAVRSSLDLLFYVNLLDVFKLIEIPYPDTTGIEASGWRSVSFVMGQRSGCFFAREDAPAFIRRALGGVSHLHPR
ncbi:DUF1780 domain-containing protein [Cognatiluteimonas profundi]|uniref:DUF1780 domain-containing protein n=1 Tax=Cognatiluteimonas profundi TaxID=2594501 RepID=UPI00131D77F1|nr:DUF1780 domain-containing protein [Lysobacter profundi]